MSSKPIQIEAVQFELPQKEINIIEQPKAANRNSSNGSAQNPQQNNQGQIVKAARRGSSLIQAFAQLQNQAELNQLHQTQQLIIEQQPEKEINRFDQVYFSRKQKAKKGVQQKNREDDISKMDDHRISLERLIQRLETDLSNGLTTDDVTTRLKIYGKNIMSEPPKTPGWILYLKECTSLFNCLLWICSIMCAIGYGLYPADPSNLYLALVLAIMVLITATVSYVMTSKSVELMESFKNFLPQKCQVFRNGEKTQVLAEDLVIGDIIEVKLGDKIPADIRIFQSREMKVDNSALTGESEPLLRVPECTSIENPLITKNLAFFGTLCKEGAGKGIVIRVADNTVMGNIANMAVSEEKEESPLSKEMFRFVKIVTAISISLATIFVAIAFIEFDYKLVDGVVLGIGILCANVPEGIVCFVTMALSITARKLSEKYVVVKDLESIETLGATSCICSDKTGTLTQNKMTVAHLWINGKPYKAENKEYYGINHFYEYEQQGEVETFNLLKKCAVISSEAKFDLTPEQQSKKDEVKYLTAPVIGDATESALIRFFQPIEDIDQIRNTNKICQNEDGSLLQLPFNSINKYALSIIEQPTVNSQYCILLKGASEKIWTFCSKISLQNGQSQDINDQWNKTFLKQNLQFAKEGERVLGFAQLELPRTQFPQGFKFNVNNPQQFNFPMCNFTFIGLIALIDPPKESVPHAILKCRSAGIKVIMVTGDQPATAAAIARQVNIIPQNVKTVDDIVEEQNISWNEAAKKCHAIVVHGDMISKSVQAKIAQGLPESRHDEDIVEWVKKPFCVFARTSPAQKLQIVKACQKVGYIVGVTGDGVNDSPAIKQANIGISMGISGSDVTKDAADMVLLNDDFSSIIDGIQEGRKLFDNLKRTIIYILSSNMVEMLPVFAFCIFSFPQPISSIFMMCISVGTDIIPAISLAYEEAELDIMTRKPRKMTDHLVTARLVYHGYLQQSWISTAGALTGYFSMMLYYGYSFDGLFGILMQSTVAKPDKYYQFNPNSPTFGNPAINPDCTKDESSSTVDWLSNEDGIYDLRMIFLQCNQETGKWEQSIKWDECLDPSEKSPITREPVCYSTEALKYAQTSYMTAAVLSQIMNVLCVKTKRISIFQTKLNKAMLYGQITEVIFCLFICYVPGVQTVLGGRPISIWQFMTPNDTFIWVLLLWEETRKYLIRNFPKKHKYSQNWFELNVFW